MQEKIFKIIQKEDRKNPLTDLQISKMLFVSRSEVTRLRQLAGIPDSRDRRKEILKKDIHNILDSISEISIRKITDALRELGYDISRTGVISYLKEEEGNQTIFQEMVLVSSDDLEEEKDPFSTIVG